MAAIVLTPLQQILADLIVQTIATAAADYQRIKEMSEEETKEAIEYWQGKKKEIDDKIKAH